MKKVFLFLVILAGILEGCEKYEDGPCISFRSAKNRLYGSYTLVKYTVNDVDSLKLYNDSLSLNFDFFYNETKWKNFCSMTGRRKDGLGCELYWCWEFTNNNKKLKITESYGASEGTGPFGPSEFPEWEILQLKNSEIKMRTNFNDKVYLIVLEAIK